MDFVEPWPGQGLPASPAEPAVPLEPAGFAIRALARLIDQLVAMGVGVAVGICLAITFAILEALGRLAPGWQATFGAMTATSFAAAAAGGLAYHAIAEAVGGATIGKLICGLRVLGEDGRPCSIGAGLIRGLAFYLDGLFFGWVGYNSMSDSPMKQRNGDRWAKTFVVRSASVSREGRRSVGALLLGLAAGLAAEGALMFAEAVIRVA